VTLRNKIILYLLLIHLVWGAIAVFVFMADRAWLLAVEAFFLISIILGVLLIKAFFVPLQLIQTGAELIEERDFSCKFIPTGQPELDGLIRVYNRMIEELREERLKQTEQHFLLEKIVGGSPSGIIILDHDGKVSSINPSGERLLQVSAADLVGHPLSQLASPFAAELEALQSGESRIVPLEGSRRLRCARVQFFDQGFPRHFLIAEELTDELRISEKNAYEKIIRMMSHEVNNSVGAISSLLEACQLYAEQVRADDRDDFSNALVVARERAHRLNAFMRGFAEVVRLPAPELRPTDIEKLLQDLGALFGPELRKRNICLKWEGEQCLQPVAMDKNQMERVLVNLLKNSIEAISEHGTITILTGKRGQVPFVCIEDTGCGIPNDVRSLLFTPFFSTKSNGQGIGLTLAREILAQHHFRFSLESRPGGPTRFSIFFAG